MHIETYKYLLAVFVCSFSSAYSETPESYRALNPCTAKQTCGECIQTKSCAWCYQPKFDRPRCYQPSTAGAAGGCPVRHVYNPENDFNPVANKSLTKARGAGSKDGPSGAAAGAPGAGDVVQISPQRVELKLRRNVAQKVSIKYSQAQDYPLDLYYLMDLSNSMKDDKEKLSALGDLLSNTMRNITSDFRLGFGSFVDKVVMPYVSTVPKNLDRPCEEGCVRPYGFRNDMSLSINTSSFKNAVKNANISGNLDGPEGGFDAMMQAVVCPQIGWRSKARRLLVFSTDAGFHYAGDGKLGGIVQPNDGACHLNEDNEYDFQDIQDYPSISQLNVKVKQNAINVIFAVTQEKSALYERLRGHIEGASSGVLSNDSSNVVDFIRDQYNKITSAVEMKDNSKGAVKVSYYSRCLGGPQGTLVETNKCEALKVGDVVEFDAEVMVAECPADPAEWRQTFNIYPVGINEGITVDLEMLCDCPCERPGDPDFKPHSAECSGKGALACGVCECDAGNFGRSCDCSATGGVGSAESTKTCRPPNNPGAAECSGRGHCMCGQCDCDQLSNPQEVITGQFCECDNFSCDRNRNMLCSGADHGTCVCGQCICKPGWSGSACDCRALNDTCIAPGSDLVCNGHGTCDCGACTCNKVAAGEHYYSGTYCDTCMTCSGRCSEYKDCVLCQYYKQGMSEEECNATCKYDIIPVKTVIHDPAKGEHVCTQYDKNDCRFFYKYYLDKANHVYIEVQEKPDCPPPVFILGIVLGVIAAIVLIGLALLLLWKIVTHVHDRREFARFEKERAMAKWDTGENPIYKEATSTFKNPAYEAKGDCN